MRVPSLGMLALLYFTWPSAVCRAEPPPAAAPPTPPPAPPPVPPRAAAPPASLVTSGLARGTIGAALRAAGFPSEFQKLDGMATRARTSALAPELFLRASRSTDQSLRLSPTIDDPAHYSEAGGAGVLIEARLIWHFDRLVFDADELSVERLKVDRWDAAAKLSARVLDLLFAWDKALRRASDGDGAPDEREEAALRRLETEITLDVLTAGWFSVHVDSRAVGARRGS